MRISIRHELRFKGVAPVQHAVQHLLLTPSDTPSQTVLDWSIAMPGIEGAARFTDAYGNTAHLVSQTLAEEDELFIAVTGTLDTTDTSGVIGRLDTDPTLALFRRTTAQTRPNGNLVNRLRANERAGMGRVDMLHRLMTRLYESREDASGDEEDAPEIIAEDHAHVFVAAARGMGIPARFVTGYVLPSRDGAAHLHAWAEAFDDQLGWIGFDPSANLCPTEAYVRLAAALDADSARPVRLHPDMDRQTDDTLRVTQVMMANQQ